MRRWAFLFPGQGSQTVGMGRELSEAFPIASDTFAEADDALGFPLSKLCFEGPADKLRQTEHTQPAVLTTSIAVARVLHQLYPDWRPELVAGHSLGEWSALVMSGALSFGDAVRLVRERGRAMQEAVPDGVGAMLAVVGLPYQEVLEICTRAREDQVCSPANLNSPKQTVISGDRAAVERARELLKNRGVRSIMLPVSAPFHCALMQPAAKRLDQLLADISFQPMQIPVVSNVDAAPYDDPAQIRTRLVRQVTSPVRWTDSILAMQEAGIDSFLEIGPGRVLTGLLRHIDRRLSCTPISTPQNLEQLSALRPK